MSLDTPGDDMKTVSLNPINRRPQIVTDAPVLDALLAEEVDILMACGARGRCATCHVFVEKGMDQLSLMEARERRTLNRISNCTPNSRLACQARVRGEGVVIRLPGGVYVTSKRQLEDLIGLRADTDIRHPIDGRILIPQGKIITRTFIMQLADVDADLEEIQTADALDK